MSLRDIYSNNEPNDISLHTESQGNSSGLGNFHTENPEDRAPNNTGKIVGALAVALMVGAAGIGIYASSGSSTAPKPMVTAKNAPVLPPPSAVPAPQQDAMTTPADANTPASTSSTDATPAPAPMKAAEAAPATDMSAMTKTADAAPVKAKKAIRTAKADTSTDHMAATLNSDKSQTVVPKQTAAAEPVSPTPSPNDVASNSTQSSIAVSPNATSASDMPAAQQQANTATPVAPEVAPTVQAPADQAAMPQAATPAPAAPAAAEPAPAAPAAQPAPAPVQ